MIEWLNSYSVGVIQIDMQHKELLNKINDFQSACMAGRGNEKVKETLNFLKTYTVKHFRDEESEMIKYNYPGYQNQKALHSQYVGIINDISQSIEKGGIDLTAILKLNSALSQWLIDHICKVDKQFGDFLNQRG